jgi:NMD protein affecting ribosome stability and mRNA decay
LNERTAYRKKLRKKWIAEGKCPNCGAHPPVPRRRFCTKCLDAQVRAQRRAKTRNPDAFRSQYHARKDAGLCVSCGVPGKALTNGLLCEGCARAERQRTVRIKYDVMQRYGGKCFCCGEDRIAFLTLDHSDNDGAARRK